MAGCPNRPELPSETDDNPGQFGSSLVSSTALSAGDSCWPLKSTALRSIAPSALAGCTLSTAVSMPRWRLNC